MRSYSGQTNPERADKEYMEITRIGQQGFQAAQKRAAAHADKIVKDGPDIDDVVELKVAEQDAAIAAKIIKVGRNIEDSLLDILA